MRVSVEARRLLLVLFQYVTVAHAIGALDLIGWGGETYHGSQRALDETEGFERLNPDQVCAPRCRCSCSVRGGGALDASRCRIPPGSGCKAGDGLDRVP
jgi:hypothetical protein